MSECDEDSNEDKEEDEDVFLSECDDGDNEDLDYVTVNLPLPFIFDEAWFEKFQIMNLIKSGLKK